MNSAQLAGAVARTRCRRRLLGGIAALALGPHRVPTVGSERARSGAARGEEGDQRTACADGETSVAGFCWRTWGEPRTEPGRFASPSDVAIDRAGNAYVLDRGNDRVQVFDQSGALLRTWGERGGEVGQFDGPSGIAVDPVGRVYIADASNPSHSDLHRRRTLPCRHWEPGQRSRPAFPADGGRRRSGGPSGGCRYRQPSAPTVCGRRDRLG